MNKLIFSLLTMLFFNNSISAQDLEKVKGDRNVTIKQTYVDAFNTIVIGEDFNVEIFYNKKPSIEIETDDNLHEFINFKVKDSVLTFSTSKKITTRRKLAIKINYGDGFAHIETKDDAEIRSLTSLELKNASLKTSGSSRAYLNIKASNFDYTGLDKAKVKLNLTANTSKIELSGSNKLDALINSPQLTVDLYQRANANIEGTSDTIKLRADNNSQFNGKNFTTNTCELVSEIASDVYIEVTEAISIEASGSSEIYLYNNPKITISKFLDTVKLQKKTK
ncbi:GIN domain-containing protein [Ichthyenterobacterium magnum]|uniref:Putative autotransporter adhesin-like protein n=1 Tax=Ichthyenterobacterium magnum TaxID=1230530 RepID=A0A420DGQ7_9FLAO|nr:DUF2807 domain-containing protein [Ichthyenterobacterium magnum]RKE92259.1 putative autotransporter adhesin-like protein [Ichthyenterobacterium magnum]